MLGRRCGPGNDQTRSLIPRVVYLCSDKLAAPHLHCLIHAITGELNWGSAGKDLTDALT